MVKLIYYNLNNYIWNMSYLFNQNFLFVADTEQGISQTKLVLYHWATYIPTLMLLLCFGLDFSTVSHVLKASPKLTAQMMLALNSSSCLHLPSSAITGLHHHTWLSNVLYNSNWQCFLSFLSSKPTIFYFIWYVQVFCCIYACSSHV